MLTQRTVTKIKNMAASSPVASHSWRDRGVAPIGYTKGMAVCFAVAYEKLLRGDPVGEAMTRVVNSGNDVFDEYNSEFVAKGMPNYGASSEDRLRHLYAFVIGLGMRESSGRYCEGRDMSASNTSADTAEAGLFQQSWNLRSTNDAIVDLYELFNGPDAPPGFVEVFREGVESNDGEFDCYGNDEGERFQETCKLCPEFAVETAAIGLRTLCNHWGPVIRHEVELLVAADDLLFRVQLLVEAEPAV